MDSVRIPWNSDILVGIQQIPPELMGESKDLGNLRPSEASNLGRRPPILDLASTRLYVKRNVLLLSLYQPATSQAGHCF